MPPVKEPSDVATGNILYDSWVLLDDDQNVKTFEKMLYTNDFENNKDGIPSLLNSEPIDKIADKNIYGIEDIKEAIANNKNTDNLSIVVFRNNNLFVP